MNYQRPPILDELAAKYALGTLRYLARARFERLCDTVPAARAAQQRWEDRLLPLALAGPEVAPGAACLTRVMERVGPIPAGRSKTRAVRWWQGAIAAGLLTALIVAKFTIWNEPTWQPMAVLAATGNAPLWRIERNTDLTQLHIQTVGLVSLPANRSYELWVLPASGANPVSLGLLPRSGVIGRTLTPAQRALLVWPAKVAVSIEPANGSPTGLPTGPVVIVAAISRSA